MKSKEVILHIDSFETECNSVQQTLLNPKNKFILDKYNLNIQDASNLINGFLEEPEKLEFNILNGLSINEIIKTNNTAKIAIKEALYDTKKLIITSELLSALNCDNIIKLKEYLLENFDGELKFKVLYYIRNPIDFINCLYIKDLNDLGRVNYTDDFKERVKRAYSTGIENYVNVFNRENVEVYCFEKTCNFERGRIEIFLNKLNVSKQDISEIVVNKTNEIFCKVAVEIAQYVNMKYPLYMDYRLGNERCKADLTPLMYIKGDKFSLNNETIFNILKYIENNLIWLKNVFGVDYLFGDNLYNEVQQNINYCELSVVDAFSFFKKPIRACLIEFFKEKNDNLVATLEDLSKKLDILDAQSNLYNTKNISEFVRISNLNVNSLVFILFTRDLGTFNKLGDDVYEVTFKSGVDLADCYRELSIILENESEVVQAYKFISIARILRPNGPIILQKFEEFRDKIEVIDFAKFQNSINFVIAVVNGSCITKADLYLQISRFCVLEGEVELGYRYLSCAKLLKEDDEEILNEFKILTTLIDKIDDFTTVDILKINSLDSFIKTIYTTDIRGFAKADFYRELGIFFANEGNMEKAIKYMGYAKELRPSGALICEKYEEFKNLV